MLNNLIESTSHVAEFKRRGFFFLFTVASYVVLFVTAGLVSILAYEAQLRDPKSELVVTLLPLPNEVIPPKRDLPNPGSGRSGGSGNRGNPVQAITPRTPFDNTAVPDFISSEANPALPSGHVRNFGNIRLGEEVGPGDSIGSGDSGTTRAPTRVEIETPPPPRKSEQPPQILRKNVINSEALSLPKPPYPPLALRHGVQGKVTVQVLIDEGGTVISAKTVSGNPLLAPAAVAAAYKAKFSPTLLGDQPVKVSGIITYNFVIQ